MKDNNKYIKNSFTYKDSFFLTVTNVTTPEEWLYY